MPARALWSAGIPLPRIRCVYSIYKDRLSTLSGEVLTLANLTRLVTSCAPSAVELDVGTPRLNDIYRGERFEVREQQQFARNRSVELALEVTDSTVMLAHLLLTLAEQRCHGAAHNSEVILRLLYPGALRRWRFEKRPDIELGVRLPPLLGLTSRSWLDWALRQVYDDVFVAVSEAPATISERVVERIGDADSGDSLLPVRYAAPAIVGAYQLTQPQVSLAIGPLQESVADKLGFVLDDDRLRGKETKEVLCAEALLFEYLQPHVKIHVEILQLP